jgi:hypothetical protein
MVTCIAGLEPTDSSQESFTSRKSLKPFFLYIDGAIVFVNEKGYFMANDKFDAHNTRSSFDYH